ncbi:MAG: hypothetical protein AB7I34_21595 [Rhizobiaceae bacterium]
MTLTTIKTVLPEIEPDGAALVPALSSSPVDAIHGLTIAAEFLITAVRAIAQGHPPSALQVQEPIIWASSKMREVLMAVGPEAQCEAIRHVWRREPRSLAILA